MTTQGRSRASTPILEPDTRRTRRLAATPLPDASADASDASDTSGASKRVMTDSQVPEGHRELHATLYGDAENQGAQQGGTDEAFSSSLSSSPQSSDASAIAHAARRPYPFIQGEDDGEAVMEIDAFLSRRALSSDTLPPMGVFAIYDASRTLQYVSYSRNIVLSVKSVLSTVGVTNEEKCTYVRAMVFQNRAMQTRQAMESQQAAWIEENGTVPPGNGVDKEEWSVGFAMESMSEQEKGLYDDKKTKMVAAMGERQDSEALGSREKLKMAVEGGDWSAVIDEQTTAAVADGGTEHVAEGGEGQQREMTTPFAQASVHRAMKEHNQVVMNMETVDKALDEVRPYLQADGGDVEVVEVENGRVLLRLQGQCSSCTASDSTMSMGIERALRANFGDQLLEVIEVGGGSAAVSTSLGTVNAAVGGLRGAIEAYGGTVEVDTVDPPHAVILYTGVKSLAYGLKMALMDQFKDLNQITFVDAETGDVIEF